MPHCKHYEVCGLEANGNLLPGNVCILNKELSLFDATFRGEAAFIETTFGKAGATLRIASPSVRQILGNAAFLILTCAKSNSSG